MSIIAVKGIPVKWSLKTAVKLMAKFIHGHFEGLNFKEAKGNPQTKTCYLRLSEKLDPVRVLERINTGRFPKTMRLVAFIPDHVPDIPLASKVNRMLVKMQRATKINMKGDPAKLTNLIYKELIVELQSKYPGLYEYNKKYNGIPMEETRKVVMDRLNRVVERNPEVTRNGYLLSKAYRHAHPHFTDFQVVNKAIHKAQTMMGVPHEDIQETALAAHVLRPLLMNNLPIDKVQETCTKYSEKIVKALTEHIKSLKSEITSTDNEEDLARKRVREELKKMAPFLPQFLKQVISSNFLPDHLSTRKMRIYGEPQLPPKEVLEPFLRRYHAVFIPRGIKLYNVAYFKVPFDQYASVMAMDGTILNGAKLMIRGHEFQCEKAALTTSNDTQEDVSMEEENRRADVTVDENEWTESWD